MSLPALLIPWKHSPPTRDTTHSFAGFSHFFCTEPGCLRITLYSVLMLSYTNSGCWLNQVFHTKTTPQKTLNSRIQGADSFMCVGNKVKSCYTCWGYNSFPCYTHKMTISLLDFFCLLVGFLLVFCAHWAWTVPLLHSHTTKRDLSVLDRADLESLLLPVTLSSSWAGWVS